MKKFALRRQKLPDCHWINKHRENTAGNGDSNEVQISTEDHESISSKFQIDSTTLKDKAIENAIWNEDTTIAPRKKYSGDDKMVSIEYPSSQ